LPPTIRETIKNGNFVIFYYNSDYNNEDVFVHSSAIIKNNPSKYKPSLSENEPVEFDILKSKKNFVPQDEKAFLKHSFSN
jgi:cold shock CspA family protein